MLATLCFLFSQNIFAQFRFDNKLYKTIFWDDLCKALQQQKDYLLLDVRSPGEYSDTSQYESLNIGHLKGALNVDIHTLPDSISKLDAYKNKTIYVYCSHSQRSRRVSKMLSEKGFTNVVNVNGGMTILNLMKDENIPCAKSIYESSNQFKILSPEEICKLVATDKNIFLIDVRNDSSFNQISNNEAKNAYGRLKKSVNIPFANLANSLSQIPKNKKIILIDDFGNESVKAAKLLFSKGYKDINVLFNGLDEWFDTDISELSCKNDLIDRNRSYKVITPEELSKLNIDKEGLMLDIRTDSEYRNIAKDYWRNIGNVKNAINIPSANLNEKLNDIEAYKNKPVVVYSFSSSPDIFSSAKLLIDKGFKNVYVLAGGLFSVRWKASNIKDHAYLNDLVTNVPADNY